MEEVNNKSDKNQIEIIKIKIAISYLNNRIK